MTPAQVLAMLPPPDKSERSTARLPSAARASRGTAADLFTLAALPRV